MPDPGEVSSEFATVAVTVDTAGNGPRLRLEDRRTGRVRYLDALELGGLVWSSPDDLAAVLDPGRGRWAERRGEGDDIVELVERLYPALAAGDREAVTELLAPDFAGQLSAGLPAPIGGAHRGARAMIDDGWWAIGRRYQVRAEPEAWHRAGSGRLVVLGAYRGHHRGSEAIIDAAFVHVWTASGGRLQTLRQVTDTVAWGLGPLPSSG